MIKFNRFKMDITIAKGTLQANPDICPHPERVGGSVWLWIKYEGQWYRAVRAADYTEEQLKDKLIKDTYSKDQLYERLLDII